MAFGWGMLSLYMLGYYCYVCSFCHFFNCFVLPLPYCLKLGKGTQFQTHYGWAPAEVEVKLFSVFTLFFPQAHTREKLWKKEGKEEKLVRT